LKHAWSTKVFESNVVLIGVSKFNVKRVQHDIVYYTSLIAKFY